MSSAAPVVVDVTSLPYLMTADVALEGASRRVVLPDAAEDVVGAVKESLALLEVAAGRITRPLHAAVFRAPLGDVQPCDAAVAIHGPTGALKSALVAVAQSHFGDYDYNTLPLNWESTANSLESDLFRAKDTLQTVDEFVPRRARVLAPAHHRADGVDRCPRRRRRVEARDRHLGKRSRGARQDAHRQPRREEHR